MKSVAKTVVLVAAGSALFVVGRSLNGATIGASVEATGCSLATSSKAAVQVPLEKGVTAVGPTIALQQSLPSLRFTADVPLPGRPVRFDYQSEDVATGRLYLSHMNDASIVVFDTRAGRVVANIGETPRVTGVWVVPELHRLYASVTGRRSVAVFGTDSLKLRASLGPIGFPDGIAYAPSAKRVFVSDEAGGGELVIDAPADRVVGKVPLGGEAGNTKFDEGSGCILVAVQTANQIVAIDPASAKVVARYQVDRADHPHGMSVDAPNRLLFVANQGNATLEVVDLRAMVVSGTVRVGEDPDVLAFDPEWARLYVATERGGLWVYHVQGRQLIADGAIDLPHAHTVSVDPSTHVVYVPLENLDGHPVLRVFQGVKM